jgi:hypothetical protein
LRKWRADIGYNGKLLWLGSFTSEEDAAAAYDDAAIKLFGKYALCNFKGVEDGDMDRG